MRPTTIGEPVRVQLNEREVHNPFSPFSSAAPVHHLAFRATQWRDQDKGRGVRFFDVPEGHRFPIRRPRWMHVSGIVVGQAER